MLGLVDSQLVRFEPVLEYQGGFRLDVTFDPDTMSGRVQLMTGLGPVEAGVVYHVMEEDPGLDVGLASSGPGNFIVRKGYGQVRFRAVLGNEHAVDATLVVERKEEVA